MWPFRRTRQEQDNKEIHALYEVLVRQARNPIFYRSFAVKDDEDGRFDLLVLHLSLTLIALRDRGQKQTLEAARRLGEWFVSDMDANLREMGAGDLGVARRVKFMAGALKGRLLAYEEALGAGKGEMEKVLAKNLYRQRPIDQVSLGKMAEYAIQAARTLQEQETASLQAGTFNFPEINP